MGWRPGSARVSGNQPPGNMERPPRDLSCLFAQLGEASDEAAISRFIANHGPLEGDVQLHEASFWTASQADFLREAILDAAKWAAIVDVLNSELHQRHQRYSAGNKAFSTSTSASRATPVIQFNHLKRQQRPMICLMPTAKGNKSTSNALFFQVPQKSINAS